MPRMIDCTADVPPIALGDLIETLEAGRLDTRDEDCFASFGGSLKALANNRDFLADLVVDELKQRCRGQCDQGVYGPQVVVLHQSHGFLLRANFWPGEADAVYQENGAGAFFYHVPHDHNFSFLTAGYMGPGYSSDYYEYDYEAVVGALGETADLRFVGRSRLEEGQVLLYRAHRDVHSQLPAESLSVSLNIVERSPELGYRDQYRFDIRDNTIAEHLTRTSIEPLLALCARVGGANARDLLTAYAAFHPSDRIQFSALQALASSHARIDDRMAVLEAGARSANAFVARMAARQCQVIAGAKSWIEQTVH